ncbi:hypothetical protein RR48_07028 [Papilio machaon]|uniref:ATPase inhibitor, mitochondrial n=1 Tax=Papilio machaon TaxID=76193 RepID=A0A194R6K5_PAPMA|nr:hypothetical protein RR48_07028 [Papilio machaon]
MKNVYVIVKTSNEMKRKSFLDILLWVRNKVRSVENNSTVRLRRYTTGSGSGAVKGEGAGRAVTETGGTFGQYGAIQEDSYFYKKQKEQLKQIKKKLDKTESSQLSQKKEDN